METKYDIKPFVELGERLSRGLSEGRLDEVIARSTQQNAWFTDASVRMAIGALCSDMLSPKALEDWLLAYAGHTLSAGKKVGIVMAGNLPLVGFADLMCVLLAGHRAWIKPSSKDRVLTE